MLTIRKLLHDEVFKVRIVDYFMIPQSLCYLILITAGLIPLAIGIVVIK